MFKRMLLGAAITLSFTTPAFAQLSGPNFVPSGFAGTTFLANGGDVSVQYWGYSMGGNGQPGPLDVYHLFLADANGASQARIVDFTDYHYAGSAGNFHLDYGAMANFGVDVTPERWAAPVSLGTFLSGDVLRFGFLGQSGGIPSYDVADGVAATGGTPDMFLMRARADGGRSATVAFRLFGVTVGESGLTGDQNIVPEPSTYALLASGLLVLGLAARRRGA